MFQPGNDGHGDSSKTPMGKKKSRLVSVADPTTPAAFPTDIHNTMRREARQPQCKHIRSKYARGEEAFGVEKAAPSDRSRLEILTKLMH